MRRGLALVEENHLRYGTVHVPNESTQSRVTLGPTLFCKYSVYFLPLSLIVEKHYMISSEHDITSPSDRNEREQRCRHRRKLLRFWWRLQVKLYVFSLIALVAGNTDYCRTPIFLGPLPLSIPSNFQSYIGHFWESYAGQSCPRSHLSPAGCTLI